MVIYVNISSEKKTTRNWSQVLMSQIKCIPGRQAHMYNLFSADLLLKPSSVCSLVAAYASKFPFEAAKLFK